MRIAVPTSDRINLFKRTGRTKEFAIYDVNSGQYEFIEFRENPHKHDHDEGEHDHDEHTHSDIVGVLKDCDALLVQNAGQHFRVDFDKADIPLYKTKQLLLKDVISIFATDMLRHKRI